MCTCHLKDIMERYNESYMCTYMYKAKYPTCTYIWPNILTLGLLLLISIALYVHVHVQCTCVCPCFLHFHHTSLFVHWSYCSLCWNHNCGTSSNCPCTCCDSSSRDVGLWCPATSHCTWTGLLAWCKLLFIHTCSYMYNVFRATCYTTCTCTVGIKSDIFTKSAKFMYT